MKLLEAQQKEAAELKREEEKRKAEHLAMT